MEAIWDFLQARDWLEFVMKNSLFLLSSLIFVWFLALILSRTRLVVTQDAELQVHFGALMAIWIYLLLMQVFIIMLAIHIRGHESFLKYTLPFLGLIFLSTALVLSLCNHIRTKLDKLAELQRQRSE